jgi:hypothetical protein
MEPIGDHEIGALEHAGARLPRPATAVAVWRLVRRPMRLRRIGDLASTARGLSPGVRAALKVRALQSLAIALDCAVQAGRSGRSLTTNLFVEALAARWSPIYRRTRDTWGSGRLQDFKPSTVRDVREELVGQGVAYYKLWKAIRGGVPGLYETSAPRKNRGRAVYLDGDNDLPFPLLADFDRVLDGDPRYQRGADGGSRLLLAEDESPPRKIAQRVAGERPYDIMHIGTPTENVLRRLEAARVFLRVPALLYDIEAAESNLRASPWPAIRRAWDAGLPARYTQAGLSEIPDAASPTASLEAKFWAAVARWNVIRARQAFRAQEWNAYLAADNRQCERDRYRAHKGRLASIKAISAQLQARGIDDDADVEIKATFYKHRTRRFQAANVWPSESSSGEELVAPVPYDVGEGIVRLGEYAAWFYGTQPERTDAPTEYAVPQRVRWFQVLDPMLDAPWRAARGEAGLTDLWGLDVSGSQAQILAVAMGMREVEDQLRDVPFKQLVAQSALALHSSGKIQLPAERVDNAALLEENSKGAMKLLYGASLRRIASSTARDPVRYGPGLNVDTLKVLFDETPIIKKLRVFLSVCEAVGRSACERNPTGGVTVVDPLDRMSFTWNPSRRRKQQIRSGAFKLYVKAPVERDGDYVVDELELVRRIAPGLIHMLDALFASIIVVVLNLQGVRDVVAVHDAFLVPDTAWRELVDALTGAGRTWLPMLGPFYDVFERYLPATSPAGEIARQWRTRWDQRVRDCEAGRDTWPIFLTKPEGARYR